MRGKAEGKVTMVATLQKKDGTQVTYYGETEQHDSRLINWIRKVTTHGNRRSIDEQRESTHRE